MHELAICSALRDEVLRIAAARNALSVRAVRVRIGPLSGVDADAIAQAYPLACAGTPCADAELVIDRAPVQVRCRACGARSGTLPQRLACARCGSPDTEIESGDEMLLSSVDLVFGAGDV
jgi:hydrogenase nickel incorporation protein HypA/HybF